jgi:succinate dehydrogenase/fumarate reductase flavoprotein subunit
LISQTISYSRFKRERRWFQRVVLTKLYARNSASANMGGEAYALALGAGAELIDMEFVQFFPIGHLAPRLVGMDPIMWDPFRYKVGGKLLNGQFEEFIDRYGSTDFGQYNATRDIAAYAILKEVEAGRGTPHGGAYLDFRHIAEKDLRAAFGPVIDRLVANGIDLAECRWKSARWRIITWAAFGSMLICARESTGYMPPARRSVVPTERTGCPGNAITEAFVFGERAGCAVADYVKAGNSDWNEKLAEESIARLECFGRTSDDNGIAPIVFQTELQQLMWDLAGAVSNRRQIDSRSRAHHRDQKCGVATFTLWPRA